MLRLFVDSLARHYLYKKYFFGLQFIFSLYELPISKEWNGTGMVGRTGGGKSCRYHAVEVDGSRLDDSEGQHEAPFPVHRCDGYCFRAT